MSLDRIHELEQALERANRLKSEFMASMSHELRTPLHTILGFSELLGEEIEGTLNPKQKRFVTHIHNDAQHLLQLINDILDLSKIEAGHLEIVPTAFVFEEALDEVLAAIAPQAHAKSLTITKEPMDSLMVEADRSRVKEILYNLLSNAVKFTPNDGSIVIRAQSNLGQATISVADTGLGVAAEEQESIFDAFHQAGATTRGVREGAGLGLAISRRLVERHGGRIWVDSSTERGSTFAFTLPAAMAQAPAAMAQ